MKNFLNAIPFSRQVMYSLLLGALPLIGGYYLHHKKTTEWERVSQSFSKVKRFHEMKAKKQALNSLVREKYLNADPHFLENALEPLVFLEREKEALDALISTPSFTGNEVAEKRYAWVSSEENTIQFSQGAVQSKEGFQESIEMLSHAVEIDNADLKKILSSLEAPSAPQLIVTDFHLEKKRAPGSSECFELNLTLLKREFESL